MKLTAADVARLDAIFRSDARPPAVDPPRLCHWCGEPVDITSRAGWVGLYAGDGTRRYAHPDCPTPT